METNAITQSNCEAEVIVSNCGVSNDGHPASRRTIHFKNMLRICRLRSVRVMRELYQEIHGNHRLERTSFKNGEPSTGSGKVTSSPFTLVLAIGAV